MGNLFARIFSAGSSVSPSRTVSSARTQRENAMDAAIMMDRIGRSEDRAE